MEKSFAPWTDKEIECLNQYQACGFVHPFTSANDSNVVLIATKDGWVENPGGPVVQNWAYKFMTEWKNTKPDLWEK